MAQVNKTIFRRQHPGNHKLRKRKKKFGATMESRQDAAHREYLGHLMQALLNMHKSKTFTDIILICENERFHVHRNILCGGSPYFASLLKGEETSIKAKTVELTDVQPMAVQNAVTFMYSGCVPDSVGDDNEQLLGLLNVAHNFQLGVLFNYCLQILGEKLDSGYFLELWNVANKYKQDDLEKTVIAYVVANFGCVSAKADFLRLDSVKLRLVLAHSDIKLFSSDLVVQGLFRWVNYCPAERKRELVDIFSVLDLSKLSDKCVKTVVNNEPIIKDVPELFQVFAALAISRLSDSESTSGVAVLSDTRLVCCGRNQTESLITIYNFDERLWGQPKTLPFTLTRGMAMAECDGYLYFIGGGDDAPTSSSSIIQYSVVANVIVKLLKLKQNSYKAGARSLGRIIYIVGGLDANGVASRAVQKFSTDEMMSNIASANTIEAHVQPLVVSLQECLYVVSQTTSTVERYSPTSDQWTRISAGHQEHLAPSVASYGGMLYLAKTWHSKVFYIYDPLTGRWQVRKFSEGPDALYGMWSHGSSWPDADFFFVRDGNMALYMYKPQQREWRKLSEAPSSPWNPHQTIICSKCQLL